VALAAALCGLLPALLPADFPRIEDVRLDTRSIMFAMAVTLAVSIICGLMPALLAKPATLAGCLSEDGIAPVGLAMRTRAARMRTSIIIGQVAIACVLLVGGALLARSFMAMVRADRGYDASHLLTARLTFPHAWDATRRVQILEVLRERLRAIPGTRQARLATACRSSTTATCLAASCPIRVIRRRRCRSAPRGAWSVRSTSMRCVYGCRRDGC
jgi:putative ABC transport system permease protein